MKVIITGGAGFIGSHVAEQCVQAGYEVVVLDNLSTGRLENLEKFAEGIRFVECDLSEHGGWEKEFLDANWVIHLAALADIVPSIQRPEDYFRSNVTGTFNVLEAARKCQIDKLIYSASSSCYGIASNYPTPESADIKAEYPYALTKRLGEELVMHWNLVYGLPSISLRFFNVYGTRSRTSGTYGAMFGVFLAQKLAKKPFTVVGDGEQTRDFTYVTDVADAVTSACKSSRVGEIYNVGSGRSVSVIEITGMLGGDVVHIPKRPGEPDCTFADISKISAELGWAPKIPIEDGVKEVLRNIDYWREAKVWTPETIADATKDWFSQLSIKNA